MHYWKLVGLALLAGMGVLGFLSVVADEIQGQANRLEEARQRAADAKASAAAAEAAAQAKRAA